MLKHVAERGNTDAGHKFTVSTANVYVGEITLLPYSCYSNHQELQRPKKGI
jgi:hypothetical protein